MPTSLYITALNRPNGLDYQRSSICCIPLALGCRQSLLFKSYFRIRQVLYSFSSFNISVKYICLTNRRIHWLSFEAIFSCFLSSSIQKLEKWLQCACARSGRHSGYQYRRWCCAAIIRLKYMLPLILWINRPD